MGRSRGGGGAGGPDPPPHTHTHTQNNHKNIGFLSNTGPDPLKNHKATKPSFNVGPSLACQRNAIQMAFRWQADDGPLLVLFGSSLPSYPPPPPPQKKTTTKNNPRQSWTPSSKIFWIRA